MRCLESPQLKFWESFSSSSPFRGYTLCYTRNAILQFPDKELLIAKDNRWFMYIALLGEITNLK